VEAQLREENYAHLYGLLYDLSTAILERLLSNRPIPRREVREGLCRFLFYAYDPTKRAKMLLPDYITSSIIEDVIATASFVRNSIGYGTYFIVVLTVCPQGAVVKYAKMPLGNINSRSFVIVDGEVSPVDKDTAAVTLSNAFRSFTREIVLGFADYHRGLHQVVLIRAVSMHSPDLLMTPRGRTIPWGKNNLLVIGGLAVATIGLAVAFPGGSLAILPFVGLVIAVVYPWLAKWLGVI
jgi:hypothetical protein